MMSSDDELFFRGGFSPSHFGEPKISSGVNIQYKMHDDIHVEYSGIECHGKTGKEYARARCGVTT